jgi:hypothetical protein
MTGTFWFFKNMDQRNRGIRLFLQKLQVIIERKVPSVFSLFIIVFEGQPCKYGLSRFLELCLPLPAPVIVNYNEIWHGGRSSCSTFPGIWPSTSFFWFGCQNVIYEIGRKNKISTFDLDKFFFSLIFCDGRLIIHIFCTWCHLPQDDFIRFSIRLFSSRNIFSNIILFCS